MKCNVVQAVKRELLRERLSAVNMEIERNKQVLEHFPTLLKLKRVVRGLWMIRKCAAFETVPFLCEVLRVRVIYTALCDMC